ELGGLTQLREAHRDVRGLPRLEAILQDLRYAIRTLRRDPAFTVFAIVIIGLLLRPLPFRDADRLVWISNGGPDADKVMMTEPAHYLDLQAQNRSFAELAAYNSSYHVGDAKLTGDGDPEGLTVVSVSGNLLPFLGVQP